MPGRTWTRGAGAGATETTATASTSSKPGATASSGGTKRRATWTRDGSKEDADATAAPRRLRADASAFEPASVKAQREALEAKMKKVEEEKAKLRAALELKAREAREKKARDAERAADAARRERAAGNLLSGFRGVRKRTDDEGDDAKDGGGFVKPEVKLSQEEIERRAVQRVQLAGTDWQVLDLPPGSQKKWVTKSYRELAKLLHPDKCSAPGAKEAFQKLNKAYGALK